ncbi:MAG: DNA polymerase III subunit gamma/tau [bacterium]|nr:DNA polymerase III subunit gamma/tau [bacterium]
MVFYRKYRPQTIKELDNEHIRETLGYSLSGSLAHAFLFTGPKGLGKTSAARIVAKAINCDPPSPRLRKGIEPCNKCEQCVSITKGTNLDILEIDAASNRGIDEIRDLREKIRLSPVLARKKVYIIDEVHMLTTEAFNALLKTLEEPPSHAVFILCTTEPHKVPETIISRCLHIAFPVASEEDMVRSLKRIVKGENLVIDDEALNYIAHLSSGSFRDGAKILEEIRALSNRKKITKELVEKRYQISNIKYQIAEMLEVLAKKDVKAGLKLTSKIVEQGLDMKYFLEQLINVFHGELLIKVGIEGSESDSEFTLEEIKRLIELLTRAHSELKYAVLPQLPLELVIIEWGANVGGRLPHVANDAQQTQIESSDQTPSLSERRHQNLKDKPSESASAFSSSASGQAPTTLKTGEKENLLKELIQRVKPYNHSVAGVLRGCVLKSYDGKNLIIETGYKFHKERLEEKKTKAILEKVCKEINGKEITISIVLKS